MNLTSASKLMLLFLVSLTLPILISAQRNIEFHPDDLTQASWLADVPCKGKENEKVAVVGGRSYRICINFDAGELRPNPGKTKYVPIVFQSYTGLNNPTLTKMIVSRDHESDYPGLIIQAVGEPSQLPNVGSCSVTEFATKIGISSTAQTDIYPLSLEIASGTETGRPVEFNLPILAAGKSAITIERTGDNEIDCWTGARCSDLQLHFKNDLPYPITLSDVSITSNDLLEAKPLSRDGDAIDANSEKDITFSLKAKSVTFTRIFSGFGKPQLKLKADFKDDFGRPLHAETNMGFQIRPNLLVLAIFLVLGAVVGTLVRIDLGRLQRAGVISKRERIIFAATTFASGILVCLIALFANIKLIVWSDQNAYSAWDPKTLFFTALIATVSGLPILYAYLKIPRRGTSSEVADPPAPAHETAAPEQP